MKNTLGISLSEEQCHALLLAEDKKILDFFTGDASTEKCVEHFKPHHTKNTKIIIGIASQHVIQQEFTLDITLTDNDILRYFSTRSIDFFGHPASQLRIDYELIKIQDTKKQMVRVVAAQRGVIDALQQTFTNCKMPPHVIDVDTFALARSTQYFASHPEFSLPSDYTIAFGLCLWGTS